ncbi:MAG: hypothetical protein RJA70_3371 [Pseudomonadota bacterium]|jgi:hypothetical protein
MARIEFLFLPSESLIQPARLFVHDFYKGVFNDAVAADQLAIAVHELLENATKAVSADPVRLVVDADSPQAVTVQTENTVNATELATIIDLIDRMHQAAGAGQYYQELLHQTSTRITGSGLGLGRVWAECGLELSYALSESRITVSARTPSFTG